MATAPITKKLKSKGPASYAAAAGQVQSLSRGLTLLEYISESTGELPSLTLRCKLAYPTQQHIAF